MRRFVAWICFYLEPVYQQLSRRFSHAYTYEEFEELVFERAGVIVSPRTIDNAAQTAYDRGLISQRALNRVLAGDADDPYLPPGF